MPKTLFRGNMYKAQVSMKFQKNQFYFAKTKWKSRYTDQNLWKILQINIKR